MTDRKELELLVRAQIQGGKDLEGVAKSINKIGDAIEDQTKAAKAGESRIDELKSSLEALNQIQKELAGQDSAIKYFNSLGKSIATSETRLESATKRYNEYLAKLEAAGKRTEAQQQTLIRYSVAVDKATNSLAKQRAALSNVEKEFAAAGMAVENLANVQQRNSDLQTELALVYQRGKKSVSEYAQTVRAAREEQAKAAEVTRQFAAAEKRADDARAARVRDAEQVVGFQQRDADALANRNAEIAAARRLDQEQAKQVARARELAALQRDIVDRSATADLVKQADAARKTAGEFTTLARAAKNLNPPIISFRDAIKGVLDPTRATRESLAGLEKEVSDVAAAVTKINGPVKNYKQQVDSLVNAQRSIGQQAGLIDSFNKQVVALRAARKEFSDNRAEVARHTAAMSQGGAEGAKFAAKLASAETALEKSAKALREQVLATRANRDTLRAAGIAANDLATAQQRLNGAARSTVSSLNALQAGYDRYGVAVERARRGTGLFADDGRTTLSYLQRLRGEVLSLVAAYGGLYTVIRGAKGAIEAASTVQGIRNQLSISAGTDRTAIDAEYAYVKAQSDRIGIEFEGASRNYAKFAASAKLAGRAREEYRYIFETFAEVGRVANLSSENIEGVFKALEQSFSKGKIQAEELRGQLGDRLFGAFQVAAQALKSQFPDLDKALKEGKVDASQLVVIAKEYRKVVAEQLGPATQSLAAQQARLNNELFDFKLAIAESGFIDSYSDALRELTRFLKSDDGKEFANTVGLAFKAMADIFIFLLKNINEVVTVVQVLLGIFAVGRFIAAGKAIKTMGGDFIALGGRIGEVGSKLTAFFARFGTLGVIVQRALGAASAYLIGWQIGTYLREKSQTVRDFGTYLVTTIAKTVAIIKASYEAAFAALPEFAARAFNKIIRTIADAARGITRIFAKLAGAAGFDELAGTLDRAADSMQVATRKEVDVIGNYRASLQKELANINKIREEMLTDSGMVGSKPGPVAKPASTTAFPGRAVGNTPTGPTDAEISKRAAAVESITRSLEALDAKIDRSQTETLDKQLAAIDSEYKALGRRIEKLGGETGKAFMARLTKTIEELRDVTIKKFNSDLKNELDAFLKKTGDAEEQAGKRQRYDLLARQSAIISDYEQLYKELADLRLKFFENGRDTGPLDSARDRLRISEAQRLEQETNKFNTDMLNDKEQALNDTIGARDKLLAAINTQKEVGNISDVEAAKQLNAIQDEYVPKINAAALATREWALANAAIFANPEQQAVFLATLDAIRARATGVKTEFSNLQQAIVTGGVNAVNNGLNLMVDGLQGLFNGTQSLGEGFRGLIQGFGQFAASFLRDIALMIIKQQIFNALARSGNPVLSAVGVAGGGVMHSGGIVGQTRNRSRDVSAGWFTNAPRYHSGGISGLAPSEYPAILEKGEEVLSKDSPRNIMNGGGMAPAGGGAQGVRVVVVDDRAKVPEAMNSPEGEQVFMQFARRNVSSLKQLLKA